MTKEQTNRLLSLVHQSASGKDAFTLQNHDEVRSLWDLASQCYTRVSIVSCTTTNNIINLSLVHSFSVTMYLFPSKRRYMSLTCTTALFGTGCLTCCKTDISHLTLCLMLNVSQNLMEKSLYISSTNHGLPMHFGMRKYVPMLYLLSILLN